MRVVFNFYKLRENSSKSGEFSVYRFIPLNLKNGQKSKEKITLREAVDAIKQNTRHFAKRQLTWFRRERDVIWVNKNEFHYNKEEILHYLSEQCRAKKSVPQ